MTTAEDEGRDETVADETLEEGHTYETGPLGQPADQVLPDEAVAANEELAPDNEDTELREDSSSEE
jgi:hypothetical protein